MSIPTAVRLVLRGVEPKSGIRDPGRVLVRRRPEGSTRAFLFLSADGAIAWDADVAWIDADGRVEVLPDNWGWGIDWPLAYRKPTVVEFATSLTRAARDLREIRRIAALTPGPERALAASRLLVEDRPENAWYVFSGSSLSSRLKIPFEKRWDCDAEHGYREEVALALFAADLRWNDEERGAFRAATAALVPGDVRREHLRLLVQRGVEPEDADLLARCHADASEPRERALAARGLFLADARRGEPAVLSDLALERGEVARRLLPLLSRHEGEGRDRFLDAVDRLADALARVADPQEHVSLGYALCNALHEGGRKPDLACLLSLARSACACRAQALVNLQAATGNLWEKDDPRWETSLR